MNSGDARCALCESTIDRAAAAHAVGGRFICEACRRLVLASEPRLVLPYADHGPPRRRRWLLPLVVAMAVMAVLFSLLFVARNAAVRQARAAQMRALVAEQNARAAAAAAAQARVAATQPVE